MGAGNLGNALHTRKQIRTLKRVVMMRFLYFDGIHIYYEEFK
jgi:hypothetical protein